MKQLGLKHLNANAVKPVNANQIKGGRKLRPGGMGSTNTSNP